VEPTGSIVPATKELDGVDKGLLDFGFTGFGFLVDRWSAASMFSCIVGGLTGIEHHLWMSEGGGAQLLAKMVEGTNVKFITTVPATPESFLQSNKPLKTLADLKGSKIRCAGDAGAMIAKMGVAVVTLPGGEIYEGVKRGVIDAFEYSTPAVNWSMAFQEVFKYMYLSPVRAPTDPDPFMVNTKSWVALAPDLQKIVNSVGEEVAMDYFAKYVTLDLEAIDKFKAYGVIVEPASQEILDELVRQADIYYKEKAAKDPFFAQVFDSIVKYQKKIRDAFPRL
jgi:TRAP-type mannitol/chloroaromatic compound transport system substrate-binding protein